MGHFKLDFTGIGVAKAGTTWIAQQLAAHPEVCIARGKETNFFLRTHPSSVLPARRQHYGSSHYDEGIEWYGEKFSHHEDGQLYGEFSNAYIADPESARLLRAHNPELKLLACFRNPTEAAYAGYYQLSRVQPLPASFEEFIDRFPTLLEYGRYHHNLQPFLEVFPRERFHLMVYDDMKADPRGFYRGICDFLGIDSSYAPESLARRVNARTVLRSRALRNLRCAIGDFMVSTPARKKLRSTLARVGVVRLGVSLFKMNEKPGRVPPMNPNTRRRLEEFYRSDTEALGRLLNRDLSHWFEVSPDQRTASESTTLTEEASSSR